MKTKSTTWFVYILRCSDLTLYTGITTDLEQRLSEHNHTEKGAKYTRGRRPVCLVYFERHQTRSEAASREFQIKKLTRSEKEALVKN